jgi:hypothetical protein
LAYFSACPSQNCAAFFMSELPSNTGILIQS